MLETTPLDGSARTDTATTPAKPSRQQIVASPRGAAIAGVIFSVLMIVGLGLIRLAVPTDLMHPGIWLTEPGRRDAVRLALYLVPFAGVSFLWFIGVLRDRLGELEDKFFATVFLGSGLLFVASMFASAALSGALLEAIAAGIIRSPGSESYYLARRASEALLNLFAMKMAGVFMFSTCTVGLRSGILPRWLVFTGWACAIVLLMAIANSKWIALLFPLWILLVSMQILAARFRHAAGLPRDPKQLALALILPQTQSPE